MSNKIALTYTGPISLADRQLSEKLYKQQATPEKGEQLRLNTLAVCFTNYYLQCMGFETDLKASKSWDPLQQILMDIADLSLKDLGFLECRPALDNAQFVYVPPEVQSNRIGYVVVQINKSFREATVLGFVKDVSTELLPINQLQSLEKLLEHLEYLSQAQQAKSTTQLPIPNQTFINLKQWFENTFTEGWQELSTILDQQPVDLDWSLRSDSKALISKGKLIDLGKGIITSVVLIVALSLDAEEMDIVVEVRPPSKQTYLPPNLQVAVLDFAGAAVMEAQARGNNKNILLQFGGEPGERFSVRLILGEVSATENFVI